MKTREFREHEVSEMLKAHLQKKSQKELAKDVGVSPQHICDVLMGRRAPAGKVLEFLGMVDDGKRYVSGFVVPGGKAVKRGK